MKMLRCLLFFLACFSALNAFAVVTVSTDAGGTRTINFPSNSIGGASTSFSYVPPAGSSGALLPSSVPSASPGGNLSGWQKAGNFGVANAATGVTVATDATEVLSNGKPLVTTAKATIGAAQVAGALGRFAVKFVGVLAKGQALYDLAKELGFTLDNSTGQLTVTQSGDGSVYQIDAGNCYQLFTGSFTAVVEGCRAKYQQLVQTDFGHPTWTVIVAGYDQLGPDVPNGTLHLQTVPYSGAWNISITRVGAYVDGQSASTITALTDAIAAKSGWPDSSALSRAVADAINAGESIPAPSPTVTGPAQIAGPSKVTDTPAQNGQPASKTTTTSVSNITYAGNTYNISNVTNTSVDVGGTVTNTTTTAPEDSPPEDTPVDTPNPDLPKLYTPKYPNGMTGVWSDKKDALLSSPLLNLTNSLMPQGIGSSGCPQFHMTVDLGKWNFGTYDLGPPCYVWAFAKVVVLIGAALLARALIFGG